MKLILLFLLSIAIPTFALDTEEPPIKKGTPVQVQSYDPLTKTYDIVMRGYEAQGPNYATLADLAAAVPGLDKARVQKKPESIVGNEYTLDNELKLQSGLKVDTQREALKKKRKAK